MNKEEQTKTHKHRKWHKKKQTNKAERNLNVKASSQGHSFRAEKE